jgi:hypothetical protein
MGKYEKYDTTEKDIKYILMVMNVESQLTIIPDNY